MQDRAGHSLKGSSPLQAYTKLLRALLGQPAYPGAAAPDGRVSQQILYHRIGEQFAFGRPSCNVASHTHILGNNLIHDWSGIRLLDDVGSSRPAVVYLRHCQEVFSVGAQPSGRRQLPLLAVCHSLNQER